MSNSSNQSSRTGEKLSGAEPVGRTQSNWKHLLAPLLWVMNRLFKASLVVMVFLGILWSFGFAMRQGWIPAPGAAVTEASATGDAKRYICPMMCVPPTTQPGRCPVCGMELVEAVAGSSGDGVSISIEPAARRLIGVRTATAKLESVNRTIRTIGSIQHDESRLSTISAYVDGRLEKLYANYVGVPVGAGDDLALIYSPELYTAQAEFLSAQDQRASSQFVDNTRLRELAVERLMELGMSAEQIDTLRQEQKPRSRIRIKSPQSGTVVEKLAFEGDYVKTGQSIYRVANLGSVWMMLDVFPDDAAKILFGQQVEAEVTSAPGVVFTGRVAFVDPIVNPSTRTVRVRVEMPNPDGKLRPGDFATARVSVPAIPQDNVYDPALAGKYISPMHPQVIHDGPGQCPVCGMDLVPTSQLGFAAEPLPEQQVVTIPRDAVLMAGNESVVYVETDPGRFEVRRIALGTLTNDVAIVAEGLSAGESVATQGNFLLDSQSQLAGNPSLLDPAKAPRFADGPLQLANEIPPIILSGPSSDAIDKAYQGYFDIQAALASDANAPATSIQLLKEGLDASIKESDIPAAAQRELRVAQSAADRLEGPLENSRIAFRSVSHALIKAMHLVRGNATKNGVTHFYCPMVPGGGGDWLQATTILRNPYWGAEMLSCGEPVQDLSLNPSAPGPDASLDEDPFAGLEVQPLVPEPPE